MHGEVFSELSIVIVVAVIVSLVMRSLHQPLIIGYILTGILVGPSLLNLIHSKESFDTFSEIGIALLLFIIGLELSANVIKRLGGSVIATALALLISVGGLGYLITSAFGFSRGEAVIVGLALFFSSTIIIAKVLSDKKELHHVNGQIAIGVILIDDIIATFVLLFVAAQGSDPLGFQDVSLLVLKGLLCGLVLVWLGIKVLPRVAKHVAASQELLFLFALAWGFGVASLVNAIGFSIEVGALFAGVALAHLPYAHQIGSRLKPLRDFFIILFFISLGDRLELDNLAAGIVPAIVLSLVVLILKPLVVMGSLGALGFTRRTSFKAGVNLSQISEFSIILVVLAAAGNMVSSEVVAIVTLVALITIAVSTYLMNYDNWIFAKLEDMLRVFERSITNERPNAVRSFPIVLVGYKNGGKYFVEALKERSKDLVVADYNPTVIDHLEKDNVSYIYGDVTDPEILDEINIEQSKLVINTVGDHAVNMALLRYVRRRNKTAAIICYSSGVDEAKELYDLGATSVVLPGFDVSNRLSQEVAINGTNKKYYAGQGRINKKELKKFAKI